MRNRLLLVGTLVWVGSALGGCIVVNGSGDYEGCVDSLDCNSGRHNCAVITVDTGVTDAMCTVVDCVSDVECDTNRRGNAGVCLEILGAGRNICYETCVTDSDCTQGGWSCNDTSAGGAICLPGLPSVTPPPPLASDYQLCNVSEDCVAGLNCAQITFGDGTGLMCTVVGCTADAMCGTGRNGDQGACLSLSGSVDTCYERCTADADCSMGGWKCTDHTDDFGAVLASICLPT